MAVKLIVCLALLTTIANGYVDNYETNAKYQLEKVIVNDDINQETNKKDRNVEITNIVQISNNTNNTLSTTSNAEVKPTESYQKTTDVTDTDAASSQTYVSYSVPTYEVHENVIDVPDNRTPAGPIIATYTRPPRFNTVKPNTTSNNGITGTEEVTEEVTETIIKNKKNLISILHVKVETDDKPKEENKVSGLFHGLKKYIHGLQKGFLNGIHSFFHKRDDHVHRYKRSTDSIYRNEPERKQNSNIIDKAEYYVRVKHISLT